MFLRSTASITAQFFLLFLFNGAFSEIGDDGKFAFTHTHTNSHIVVRGGKKSIKGLSD